MRSPAVSNRFEEAPSVCFHHYKDPGGQTVEQGPVSHAYSRVSCSQPWYQVLLQVPFCLRHLYSSPLGNPL